MAKAFLIRLAIFVLTLATFLSLPLRPLWVDEIYQLEATRDLPVSQMLHSSMIAPGGMPLGYLAQSLWLKIAGYSPAKARLPAALFGMGAIFATAWIARQLSLNVTLTIILGLLTPILFRYSTEARPYSQGLFFSVLSTALFISWHTHPSKWKWLAYLLANIAGIYSQPFAVFTAVAHAFYLLLVNRKRFPAVASALVLTGAAYGPWFLLSQRALRNEVWLHEMFFSWRQVSPLVIIREISGGGFVCSLSLLFLVFLGIRKRHEPLLWCCALIPAVLAIAADASFNYFFAIRQLIFIAPPLLLLATAAVESFENKGKYVAAVLVAIFVAGALVKDVNWQRDRREDWGKAATAIKNRLQTTQSCVYFDPPRDAHNYYFFDPSLRLHACEDPASRLHALVAVSPYAVAEERHRFSPGEKVGGTLIVAPVN